MAENKYNQTEELDMYQALVDERSPEFFCDNCGFIPLNQYTDTSCAPLVICRPNAVKEWLYSV